MPKDTKTRELLLECATKEFIEKGYKDASLRNICRSAGLTTGAMYFFFKGKEDLFNAVVEKPVNALMSYITNHFELEKKEMQKATYQVKQGDSDLESFIGITEELSPEDISSSNEIIKILYSNRELVNLIVYNSAGTRYEHLIDEVVEIVEKHYRYLADGICKVRGIPKIDKFSIHWIAHEQVDIFLYLLEHVESEKEALKLSDKIVKILYSSWIGLFKEGLIN